MVWFDFILLLAVKIFMLIYFTAVLLVYGLIPQMGWGKIFYKKEDKWIGLYEDPKKGYNYIILIPKRGVKMPREDKS